MKFWLAPLQWRSARPIVPVVLNQWMWAPSTATRWGAGHRGLSCRGPHRGRSEGDPGRSTVARGLDGAAVDGGGYVCGTTPDRALSLGTGALVFGVELLRPRRALGPAAPSPGGLECEPAHATRLASRAGGRRILRS